MKTSETITAVPPLVSVCIPTYLGATHLGAAIDSVLAQSLTDFELIVIDDNSPDDTAELVAGYDDPRLRCLKNSTNLGPEGNWNRCLQEARGRYFKLLPQDDLLYPDTLERQVNVLENDSSGNIAFVFGSRIIIGPDGNNLTRRGYPREKEGLVPAKELIRRCVRFGTNLIGEPGSVLVRKALVDTVGPFDGEIPYVIDLDYWVRLLHHGHGYYLNKPVSAFRVSSGSWSVAIGSCQSADYQRFIYKLRQDPTNALQFIDVLSGNLMAKINTILRSVFYRFILKRGT